MKSGERRAQVLSTVVVLLIPVVCGVMFLYANAPRNWSLHWAQPKTLVEASAGQEFSAANTPRGYDVAYESTDGHPVLARFDGSGHRLSADLHLHGSPSITAQSMTLGRAGEFEVVAWRQDTNAGSELKAAIITPGAAPQYRTLVSGTASLEHPKAFADGTNVGIVFSWQRSVYNVFLVRITPAATVTPPVQLTHAQLYAYNPHASVDSAGTIHLVYMDLCCQSQSFRMMHARFAWNGRPLGQPEKIAQINSLVTQAGNNSTPERWGLDVVRDGKQVAAAWSGDDGIQFAKWYGPRKLLGPLTVVPGVNATNLALAVAPGRAELVWQESFELGSKLTTVQLGPFGTSSQPDRVAFEATSADSPVSINIAGQPALLWQAVDPKSTVTRIEGSHFTAGTLGAPSLWSKFGLGLANPLGNFLLVLIGAVAVGALLTVANALVVLTLLALYLLVFRRTSVRLSQVKWYAYIAVVAGCLYGLFVQLGAPSPPVLFLNDLSNTSAIIAVGGMVIFVTALMRVALRRIDELYRAVVVTFAALYFIAFLQAMILLEGQVSRI